MKRVMWAAAAALMAVGGVASAQKAQPQADPARLSDHIKTLSSDAFEGRAPATEGERKTIAYISAQYKALGLAPAGDHGTYLQDVPLRRFVTPGPITVGLTEDGRPHPLKELDDVVVHTLLPTSHVNVRNAPLVFIGYGVDAPERQWDDFKGVDLKGKVAVVLVNDPDFEMDPSNPLYGRFEGKAETYYGRWTYKYAEAAKYGAIGVLIVHETAPASYGWATVKNSNSQPQFDIVRSDPRQLHPLVEGWIQRDVAVQMFKAAGLDFEAEKKKAQSEDFHPVALKGETFSADYAVQTSTIVTHNVIGKLTGTRWPGEAILYGAHWDHLGIGPPDARGDRIYNGAVDNASGVASVLELARLFAQAPRTERSVYFIAFTSEEKGLLGSEYYAAHPVTPLATTVALLNFDVMNLNGKARDTALRGNAKSGLDDLVAQFAAEQGRSVTPEAHPESGSFFRADHFSLAKAGVPAITLSGGTDLVNGGRAAGEAAYRDYTAHRYHQPADEWRPDWDYSGAAQDIALYYDLGRYLAEHQIWPDWKAGSEFKAARDATAAARK
ncbi:MAG TPA: M28 family metallopeptidase [Caulobacteraceae bacterium]|jgi:Zn-dependent M28 family amino/carboxypeptidase|nr:M28 family metallopeptidase [Caulobacteraceae bacterium]